MAASGEELFVMAAYLSGAVCIVLFTLSVGWIIVWKLVLSKMPFIQELFDLKPATASANSNAHEDVESIPGTKPISFQDRVEATKRVSVCVCGVLLSFGYSQCRLWCEIIEAAVDQVQVDRNVRRPARIPLSRTHASSASARELPSEKPYRRAESGGQREHTRLQSDAIRMKNTAIIIIMTSFFFIFLTARAICRQWTRSPYRHAAAAAPSLSTHSSR